MEFCAVCGAYERGVNMSEKKLLGIIGGLGPMAGVCLCEQIVLHTEAKRDQDHIDFLLSSRASIPDRTAFIVGKSDESPLPALITEVKRLTAAGAEVIAIPCNSSHYFYDEIAKETGATIIHMPRETASFCRYLGLKKVGVLATEGSVRAGIYREALARCGVEYMTCSEEDQKFISATIYEHLKQGREPDYERFLEISRGLIDAGCEAVILGCTELSCIEREIVSDICFVDPMYVLAAEAIAASGAEPIGFDALLLEFLKKKGE